MHRSWRLRRYLSRYVLLKVTLGLGDETRSREEALFPVGVVPVCIVFDEQGREVGRARGYKSPEWVIATLSTIACQRERLDSILVHARHEAQRNPRPIPYPLIKDWIVTCLKCGWLAEGARLLSYTDPGDEVSEFAAQAWRVDTRLFLNLYERAAWSGRDAGWKRLELPPELEEFADPRLRELISASRRRDGPTGEALRVALREARRQGGGELVAQRLERGLWEGCWPDIVRFAARVGCREQVHDPFLRYLAESEVSRLDDETVEVALSEVVRFGGPVDLLRKLTDEYVRRTGGRGLLTAQAFYLLGEADRAMATLQEMQRHGVEQGWLRWAHSLAEVRARMARGEWMPEPPGSIEWPRP